VRAGDGGGSDHHHRLVKVGFDGYKCVEKSCGYLFLHLLLFYTILDLAYLLLRAFTTTKWPTPKFETYRTGYSKI
jgi:hypothetical protein